MDEDDDFPPPERLPFIGDSVTGIYALGTEEWPAGDVPQHLVEILTIRPLSDDFFVSAEASDCYQTVLDAHCRLMMERDLRGLRLPRDE